MAQGRMRGRVAKAAISAALTGVMAFGGVLAPVGTALAEDTVMMEIVKSSSSATEADTYTWYRVLPGTLNETEDGIKNVTLSDAMRRLLQDFLRTYKKDAEQTAPDYYVWLQDNNLIADAKATSFDGNETNAINNADNIALFISDKISEDAAAGALYAPIVSPDVTIAQTGTFAEKLAEKIVDGRSTLASDTDFGTTTAGTAEVSGTQYKSAQLVKKDDDNKYPGTGFYLFAKQDSGADSKVRPIWTLVGNPEFTQILEKSGQPTILKEVYDEDTKDYGKIADETKGEDVEFRITAVLNGTENKYYHIVDTLADRLVLSNATSGIEVYKDEVKEANKLVEVQDYTYTYFDSRLTIKLTVDGTKITGNETIIVKYKVYPSADATMGVGTEQGQGYNVNTAQLLFSGSPIVDNADLENLPEGVNTTTTTSAKVATYQIELDKVEKNTGAALKGAEFTIKTDDKYVQQDGSLGDTAYTFKSDSEGKINVPRVDADTYTISETKAPSGYKKIDDINLVITSTKNTDLGTVTALSAVANNGQYETAEDLESGLVTVVIPNDREIILPITGLTPNQLGTIIGFILVAGGAAGLIARSRRQAAEA